MDSARYVTKRMLPPRLLGRRLMENSRHVMQRIFVPRFLSQMASCDEASNIQQSLRGGGGAGADGRVGGHSVESVGAAVGRAVHVEPRLIVPGFSA
jgi:hypothetical protein